MTRNQAAETCNQYLVASPKDHCFFPKDYCIYGEISNKPPFKQLTGALQVIGQSQGWLHLRKFSNLSTLGKQKLRFPKYLMQKKGALQLLTWRQAYFVLRGIS